MKLVERLGGETRETEFTTTIAPENMATVLSIGYRLTKNAARPLKKNVEQNYLRHDIPCRFPLCSEPSCTAEEGGRFAVGAEYLVIVEPETLVRQIDFFEAKKGLSNVVVCQTALDFAKRENYSVYTRLRALIAERGEDFAVFSNENHFECRVTRKEGESLKERDLRALCTVWHWYKEHLKAFLPENKIVFVADDVKIVDKAINAGCYGKELMAFAAEKIGKDAPQILDLIVDHTTSTKPKKGAFVFEEFLPTSVLESGVKAGKFHQGTFHVNRNNCLEGAIVSFNHKGFEGVLAPSRLEAGNGIEVLIKGRENMNRVCEGDVVVVQLLPVSEWGVSSTMIVDNDEQEAVAEKVLEKEKAVVSDENVTPCGKIVGVVKRNWKPLCGSFDDPKAVQNAVVGTSTALLFRPMDRRYPKIRVRTRQGHALAGKRVVVSMDGWERDSVYPSGHFVRELGFIGDVESESEALLLQYDIPYRPFSENVLNCLPPLPWTFDEARDMGHPVKYRRDLRHLDVCSVDPVGCKDIDDALHCRRLPNGNYEVGVHIADVSHFVQEGTALDQEAQNRSTSVYLADRRIDMLPKPLTEDICSLVGGADRLCFSVIWEFTPKGSVVKVDFCKGVIRSRYAFNYEEAQLRIDDPSQTDVLTQSLRDLMMLSKILRAKRLSAGALVLGSAQVKFTKDDNYQPVDIELYKMHDTNEMVEEWMLAANVAVAEKIYAHYPSFAVLRNHPAPNPDMFKWLQTAITSRGQPPLDLTDSSTLGKSLDRLKDLNDPMIDSLIRMLSTRCLMQAKYFSSGSVSGQSKFHHYGLAMDIYTHFTSPIRRYADLLVHRELAYALGIMPLSTHYNSQEISRICDTMNLRHTMAQYAGRASSELHTVLLFRGKTFLEDGYVSRLRRNGFLVYIPKYCIEGIVHVTTPEDPEAFTMDEEKQVLVSRDGKITLHIFDKVKIHISVDETNPHELSLRLLCVDPAISVVPGVDVEMAQPPKQVRRLDTETTMSKREGMTATFYARPEESPCQMIAKRKTPKKKGKK